MNRRLTNVLFSLMFVLLLCTRAEADEESDERSLIRFLDTEKGFEVAWALDEGVGVWPTCGGPFKPIKGEYVVAFHGCFVTKVTDRVPITLPERCHDRFDDAVLQITKAFFLDEGYRIHGETLEANNWPLGFRREKREAAWEENKWYEVHYAIVGIDIREEIRASFWYQTLAGPQNYEEEMRDVSRSSSVKYYFREEVEHWTRIVRYLHNQFLGKCSDTPSGLHRIEDSSDYYWGNSDRFVASEEDIFKYFVCDYSRTPWCSILSSI